MGHSVIYKKTSHISFSAGIISSDLLIPRTRYLGSSGSFKGDSGGSCWSDDDNKGRPASPASGGRCGIIPITAIRIQIIELSPPEEDIEWDELTV